MKNVFYLLVLVFISLNACNAVKKVTCDQNDLMAQFAANKIAEVMVCKQPGLIKDDLVLKLNEVLKCNADAGVVSTLCEVAIEQAIMLIPSTDYTKYECNLHDIAEKIKPMAKEACAMLDKK